MPFTGFTEEQFQVFERADFAERMAGLRSLVRPALLSLGQELAQPLSDLAGHPLYPRVALHARRKVNPPDDTWVAFSRSDRGYKACAHFAVGITAAGVYVGLVLKDEAQADRAALGSRIVADPEDALALCQKLKGWRIQEWKEGNPAGATVQSLLKLGDALIHRKTATLHLVREIPRDDRRLADPAAVSKLLPKLAKPLLGFYEWSIP